MPTAHTGPGRYDVQQWSDQRPHAPETALQLPAASPPTRAPGPPSSPQAPGVAISLVRKNPAPRWRGSSDSPAHRGLREGRNRTTSHRQSLPPRDQGDDSAAREPFCPRRSENLKRFLLIYRSDKAGTIGRKPDGQWPWCLIYPTCIAVSRLPQAWSGPPGRRARKLRILDFAVFAVSRPADNCWGRAISGVIERR